MRKGDRVKYSEHVLGAMRTYARSFGAPCARKSEALRELQQAEAYRGTVTAVVPDARSGQAYTLRVLGDDGRAHDSLWYRWVPA